MTTKTQRQQRIREILARNEIHSQEQLQDLLHAEEIMTTQATLSRDLRDLGAVRERRGYVIPTDNGTVLRSKTLRTAVKRSLTIERGGTVLVVRTEPGHAQPLAVEIDKAGLRQVLGTVAGRDTVFVATETSGQATELMRVFQRLAK